MRVWIVLPMVLVLLSSLASLAVMAGFRFWPEPDLQAELEVQNFRLPAKFELDPEVISDELSRELSTRAQQDFAIRTLLGREGQTQVSDLVVPRLLNASVIRRLIREMESLGTVISVASYNGLVTGRIENRSDVPMTDVALILPGAVRAESIEGQSFEIVEPESDLQAITFGALEAGQTIRFSAWFETVPDASSAEFANRVRLGAAQGIDGTVDLLGHQDWFGRPLQVVAWARWTVSATLALAFVGSLAALTYQLGGLIRAKRRRA